MFSYSVVSSSVTPWTVACQAPLSMGFSRQEYWSGLPCPTQRIFTTQGSNPGLTNCGHFLYCLNHQGRRILVLTIYIAIILSVNNQKTPILLSVLGVGVGELIILNIWKQVEMSSEKAVASHSSTLAWKIPWMEEPGRLQSRALLRVRHD